MLSLLVAILSTVRSSLMSRDQLILQNLALRRQLVMLQQSAKRPQVPPVDRLFWILFSKTVDRWRAMLHVLHPDTVVRWHRWCFRRYGTFKSRRRRAGRPPIDAEIRTLIRRMQSTNVGWGACAYQKLYTQRVKPRKPQNVALIAVAHGWPTVACSTRPSSGS